MPARLLRDMEVASALHKSVRTLYRMSARGEGPPSLQVGKCRLYPENDFTAWIAARTI